MLRKDAQLAEMKLSLCELLARGDCVVAQSFYIRRKENWIRKNIILLPQLPIHQANHILEILMKQFLQTVLPDLKDSRDMMYFSRQEQINMDRKLS